MYRRKRYKSVREGVEMTKRERRERARDLQLFIRETQKKVSYEIGLYKTLAKSVNEAARDFQNADIAYSKKPSVRNSSIYEETKAHLLESAGSYKRAGAQIAATVDSINEAYAEWMQVAQNAVKVKMDLEKYNSTITESIRNIQAMIEGVEIEDAPKEEEKMIENNNTYEPNQEAPAQESASAYTYNGATYAPPAYAAPAYPHPAYAHPAYAQPAYVQPPYPGYGYEAPKVAPVSIDVSAIVEKAIAATMNKFSEALDKRIATYMENYELNLPAQSGKTYGAGEIAAVEATILEDEQFLLDKLTAMMESIKALTAQVAELSAAYAEIASKSADANELQKQTNDMQRRTLREQQGIQVSQRVISQDQISVAQNQTALAEQQKVVQERQQAITEAQAAMEETQRVVAENQATLEESMKTVMQSQKDIIAAQQALMAGNTKNAEAQAEMAARQAETLALQKEALTSQKQVLRDQKSTLDKQKDVALASPKKKAPKAESAE